MAPSAEATAYVFHHVVLPPKLPQAYDHDPAHERSLFEVVIQALKALNRHVKVSHIETVTSAIATVENLRGSRDGCGNVSEVQLQDLLAKLTDGKASGAVPLEIKEQNAAILVSQCADSLNFEFFELSPTNESAMRSGRLVRTFPGYASSIPTINMQIVDLRKTIAGTIAKMTTQSAPGFQPQVRKNKKLMDEDRDTCHPGLVTDFFMNVVTALGEPTDVKRITKHTREDVLWRDCRSPWRRSPLWLLLRVSIQLLFLRHATDTQPTDGLYKAFMVFMLARLLDLVKKHLKELGSETIHIVSAKLTRRLRKFELLKQTECLQSGWIQPIQTGLTSAHNSIKTQWQGLIESTQTNIDTTTVHSLRPETDLDMNLLGLDTFLSQVAARQRDTSSSTFRPTSTYPHLTAAELPSCLPGSDEYRHFRLAAFEKWVEQNLSDWVAYHHHDAHACGQLRRLLDTYYVSAIVAYAGTPINLSVMYLTLAELWVACDRCASAIYPMLGDYDPEVCLTEFQCLVLPLKSQMERLKEVECYVQARQDAALKSKPSIYRKFGDSSSFAVRYFDQSDELQAILSEVESDATDKRQQKCNELKTLKREYQRLMDHYDSTACDYHDVIYDYWNNYSTSEHKPGCRKCASKASADAMTIQIYEWPVSSERSVAKATVFELKLPQAFGDWRDASAYMITTVLGCQSRKGAQPMCSYTLNLHKDLCHMLSTQYSTRCIIPLSEVKPHSVTHRKHQKAIPHLGDDDVCLKNALRYAYYDSSRGSFTTTMPSCMEEIPKKCMYQMPPDSKTLERFMYHPPSSPDGLPVNEVIASLSDCPAHFSIDEYKALGAMPLGRQIIYSNILAQLAIPTVDLTKVETQCFVLQATQQAGLSDQHIERASHHVLTEAPFGHAMLEQLKTALQCVEKNWESWRAAATFSLLARRVLSLSSCPVVRSRAFDYLVDLRRVCLTWLLRLKERAGDSTDDQQRSGLFSGATEIALLCTTTYDVEDADVDTILQQESAISTLLQSSITVQENHGSVKSEYHYLYDNMLQSWRSLMYRLFPKLHKSILRDNGGLCEAVTANWPAFEPDSTDHWASLNKNQEHWLQIQSGTLPVHFNLLTAELLVNGLPLARLPPEFMRHSLYTTLFQKATLEVVPTDQPGMQFSANALYHGYKLHFGMSGEDMHVVAIGDSTRLDLVPSRTLQSQLPHAFLANFIHWYDHTNDEVLFRPRQTPWQSDTGEWRLTHDKLAKTWRLVQGPNTLVNVASRSARTLSGLFRSVEDSKHIHVMLDRTTHTVEIVLPRVQLEFYVEHRAQEVHSRQHRGMVIDSNQNIGALVGLASKLTLKSMHSAERLVLIPVPRTYGKSSIAFARSPGSSHLTVMVDKDKASKVYAYSLDTDLGRILDSSELQSRLFLSYLHAITSAVLPDPLTGHTGVEASLAILQSAAVRSFDVLSDQNIELLTQIASLSPERAFYPPDEKVMQNVDWHANLPSLSQDLSFRVMVESIFDQATKMQFFHPGDLVYNDIYNARCQNISSTQLDQRDAIRTSTFRVSNYGAERFTTVHDTLYDARDRQKNSQQGHRAFVAASMILRNGSTLHNAIPYLNNSLIQKHFRNAAIKGVQNSFDLSSLRFDSKWLGKSSEHLVEGWCNFHRGLVTASSNGNQYDILAWLSTMAYAESADMNVIGALAAFYKLQDFATIHPPSSPVFDLARGDCFNSSEIRTIIQRGAKTYKSSAEAMLPKQGSETNQQHSNRIHTLFQQHQGGAMKTFLEDLQRQWPTQNPSAPASTEISTYFAPQAAIASIGDSFKAWFLNRQFLEYLEQLSAKLARQVTLGVPTPHYVLTLPTKENGLSDSVRHFAVEEIFAAQPPSICRETLNRFTLQSITPPCEPHVLTKEQNVPIEQSDMKQRLENLCQRLMGYSKSKCEQDYVEHLRSSCTALNDHVSNSQSHNELLAGAPDLLQNYLCECQSYFDNLNLALEQSVESHGLFSIKIGLHIQQSPRISPTFWLGQLHRDRFGALSEPWKDAIIEYALAITHLHRAKRLMALSNKPVDLIEEILHAGHLNWDVREFPETLLLEAEAGIMVREEQEYIANQMRSPKDGDNIVLQLLMGGGKSTTIVPIVSAYLGDKKKVIVAKPQSKQMLQMLVAKLGGLLNRRIYQMPFSRALKLSATNARAIRDMYEECIANRGVLLIQPEHILSFKLMAIECVLTDQHETAKSLLSTQEFEKNSAVDVVDESDENFSVKFELIYTLGSQQSIEFAPERWLIIQDILGLLPRFALQVNESLPEAFDIQHNGDGKFPRIRFLRPDAADQTLILLAKYIVEYGISRSQPPKMQAAILRYISEPDLEAQEIQAVEDSKFWTESTKSPLLLMRGLLAGGVMRFVFGTKRWRVNFGLDATRTPSTSLAVPYRSKDSPSPRSEFSHPDVVLILTLLSSYYGGLSDEELFATLAHVMKSDQSAIHYDEFVSTASSDLPKAFKQLSGVSIRDRHQCITDVFPALRYSRKAVDYYLSYLVFPKQLKQFPSKLSGSGWDLAAIKTHPTTGFSGTNDTLHLLPLEIKHLDLPSQKHTNAQVLAYLLQEENSVQLLPPRTADTASDGEHLLNFIENLETDLRVLLDCGASILEQNNKQVAETWLKMRDNDIQAVVYFEDEELSVLNRAGRVESFQTSPFAKMLDSCIVYLDEAHTRGTDLKLARDYRAAVTLGSALSKDRLTQASMRMRKLGHGQAVTFIVPEEIRTKIYECTGKPSNAPIEVSDVLIWSTGETWSDLKKSMPLWAVQGQRFESHKHLLNGASTTKDQAKAFMEDEAQDLETRYRPRTQSDDDSAQLSDWDMSNKNIAQIVSRCRDFGAMGFGSAALSEEQERELAPEIEEERQIERPPRMVAHKHGIHPHLERLVRYGQFSDGSTAYAPAFQALRSTSAGKLVELSNFPKDLLVTLDYMYTVKVPPGLTRASFISDSFQRPVQFVLSVPSSARLGTVHSLVIISPYEANGLLPMIREFKKVTLHLFSPRSNASFASLDQLLLYNIGHEFSPGSVSRSLTTQLNLFAGSLYLRSLSEYNELCDFLGLLRGKTKEGQHVWADGFIDPPVGKWGLKTSPVPFLRTWLMKIRREGEGVSKTHMGRILNSITLEEGDFKENE
ncbi:hypothetical protein EJ02DRAFT_490907 [Clathrospora elynae]|uniref:ubiquitinyl hydrolase 1 n=1 Tax=Clathrospora elynae TaxID=706981 RepID=A0A6A5SXP6_9PLEO|nr:hypothetical protein EJ02DRAFT_490907 [Clathrospora elynae]